MSNRLRVGVLGTGSIAAEVTDALHLTRRCAAEAVASRDSDRAARFAAEHGVRRALESYQALIADPKIDVVYISTPHPEHAEWAVRAAEAGKHVLCEKPLTLDAATSAAVIETARRRGVFLLEAFAFHFHSQTERLLELVRNGTIGTVQAIAVTFSYSMPGPDRPARVLANALGGGGILDVGCYCTSMSRRLVMAATGTVAVEPDEVAALAALDPLERTDRYSAAVMRFAGDILAQLACGVDLMQDDRISVYGSQGQLHVSDPCWLAGRRDAPSRIEIGRSDGEDSVVHIPGGQNIFALEADGMAQMLDRGVASCHPSWDETMANMRTLDRWRSAVGVHYEAEATA
ncbi:MAG: Gfo/Idh/MocA family oxidoreductase [Actinomycetota bacterium]|nr:Gfo/Idh/MocA family oxidoreductase [Actinomycetota bacterium]